MKKIITIIIYLLLIPNLTLASLVTDATGDLISHGNSSIHDNITVGTYLTWIYGLSSTQRQTLMRKQGSGEYQCDINESAAGNPVHNSRQRATTYTDATAPSANFAAYGINKWIFVACLWNSTSDVATDQKLLIGDLTTPAQEPTSYTTQSAGSGASSASVNRNLDVSNTSVSLDRFYHGRVAWAGLWNRALSLSEIRAQQFRPHLTSGNILFVHYGFSGTGYQPDWSGKKNHGTTTGVTLAPHVPIGRYRR